MGTTKIRGGIQIIDNTITLDDLAFAEQLAYNTFHTSWLNFPGIVALWNSHYSRAVTGNHPNMLPTALTLTGSGGVTRNRTDGVPTWAFASSLSRYLSITDNAPLSITGTESNVSASDRGLTFGCWFKGTDTGNWDANSMGLISKWLSGGDHSYLIQVRNNLKIRIYLSETGLTGAKYAESTGAIVADKWYFIVGRFRTSTGLGELYINGNEFTVATGFSSIYDGTATFYVGSWGVPAADTYLDGRVSGAFVCGMHVSKTVLDNYYNLTKIIFEKQGVLGDPP